MHGTGTDLPLTAAYWKFGLIHSDDVVRIAIEALQAGLDSPSLYILAGEDGRTGLVELGTLFDRTLKELSVPVPLTEEEAAKQIALHHAQQIVTGEVTPWDGAHAIELEVYMRTYPHPDWIMPLMSETFQHEEFQMDVQMGTSAEQERAKKVLVEIDAAIVTRAKELISALS